MKVEVCSFCIQPLAMKLEFSFGVFDSSAHVLVYKELTLLEGDLLQGTIQGRM